MNQSLRRLAIRGLTAGQEEGERAAPAVAERVDLGRATAPADAEGLNLRPPFPPVAERCALTWVESSSTSAGGPPAADRAWNTSYQTPLAAQRTNRL